MASTMRKRLDKIRFRGHRQDDFLDQPDSHNTSDTECPEEVSVKPQIPVREPEELREVEGEQLCDAQVLKSTRKCWFDRGSKQFHRVSNIWTVCSRDTKLKSEMLAGLMGASDFCLIRFVR